MKKHLYKNSISWCIFFILYIMCSTSSISMLSAQKILQMEKYGSLKTQRYYMGNNMTYRLKGDKTWYRAKIENIRVEDKIVIFNNRYVELKDIMAIKTYQNRAWSQKVGGSLMVFGASWSLFAAGGMLVDKDRFAYRWSDAAVTGTSILSGLLIRQIFKSNTYKMGKRRWLRLLNINPKEEPFRL